jgi:predicted DNA-binding transcriptional regulator AlpA
MDILNDRFLKPSEVCKLLKISRATLWNWQKSGVLPPAFAIGSTCRYSEKDINQMIFRSKESESNGSENS